ncbi:MAG TPA: ABC transporter permease subunit, partial [Pyrinomonadaceae bacterium]
MFRFILRRMLVTVPMVLVVISLTWALIRLAPGNFYASERKLPASIEKNIRAKYGLDDPWYVQYGKMMGNILRLDFGNSLRYETETVNDVLRRTVPVSAAIGTCAYLLALLVGITAGTLAALKQNSKLDYAAMGLSMLGISLPNFVLGPILVLVFSLTLYWLPPARWGGFPSWNMVLPVLTLSAIYMAYIARLTRAGMLEVLRSDYIRTARAKGLTERQVVTRHALRGGLLPVVSFTGPALAILITGTVVVERIFAM